MTPALRRKLEALLERREEVERLLADPAIGDCEIRVALLRRFAAAVGARGMVWGQARDIAAAEHAHASEHHELPEEPAKLVEGMVEHLRTAQGGERVAIIRTELQQTMDNNAAAFRTEKTLTQALEDWGVDRVSRRILRIWPRRSAVPG